MNHDQPSKFDFQIERTPIFDADFLFFERFRNELYELLVVLVDVLEINE